MARGTTPRRAASETDLVAQVVDYALFTLDLQGHVSSWNAGAERLTGYRSDEILGRSFRTFYPPEDQEAGLPDRLLQQARDEGRVEHEGWRVRRDGSRFWGDAVITALRDQHGQLTGFGEVTRDLTDRKLLEEAQDSFYATFEHDFRNPVAAIRGASEALARDPGEERREELLERIRTNADRLLAMTGELVEYARLRSGSTTLHLETLDLVALATETVAGLGVVTEGGRVRLDGGCASIEADRVSVERIIVNLVANALRYSEPGTVVEVRCDPGPPGFSRLTVRDQGRGIAARDLPHIFTEFERGPLARDDGGAGLGLASVKKLVAANGGRIVVESAVGTGTTVAVDFPHRA